MTKPYTDADVELVAQAMRDANSAVAWQAPQTVPLGHFARIALDALAATGRLAPVTPERHDTRLRDTGDRVYLGDHDHTDDVLDDCAFCAVRGVGRDRTAGCPIHADLARPVVAPYGTHGHDHTDDVHQTAEVACPSRYAAPTGAVVGCRQTGLHNVHSNLAAGGDRVAWMTGDLSEVA